jgi:hypothetical protein
MRHFPFGIAGHRHRRPPRVLAPQRGVSFISATRRDRSRFIRVVLEKYLTPQPSGLLVVRTPDIWTCLKAHVRVCPGGVSLDKDGHVRVLSGLSGSDEPYEIVPYSYDL